MSAMSPLSLLPHYLLSSMCASPLSLIYISYLISLPALPTLADVSCTYIYIYTSVILSVDTHIVCGTNCEVDPIVELIWSKVRIPKRETVQDMDMFTLSFLAWQYPKVGNNPREGRDHTIHKWETIELGQTIEKWRGLGSPFWKRGSPFWKRLEN